MANTPIDTEQDFAVFAAMVEERGPSLTDFQQARGFSSTSVAHYHLSALIDAGLIEKTSAPTPSGTNNAHPYRLTAKGKLLRDTLHAVLERVS